MEVKNELPQKKRRVSLFRRRKKASLRPLVQQQKKHEYRKILLYFAGIIAFLVLFSSTLYFIRMYVIEELFLKNGEIISPQSGEIMSNDQIKQTIQDQGLTISQIQFATESGIVTFTLNKNTKVFISTENEVESQMQLVEAIDRQIRRDGKQAITIDLRYNKPIVKF